MSARQSPWISRSPRPRGETRADVVRHGRGSLPLFHRSLARGDGGPERRGRGSRGTRVGAGAGGGPRPGVQSKNTKDVFVPGQDGEADGAEGPQAWPPRRGVKGQVRRVHAARDDAVGRVGRRHGGPAGVGSQGGPADECGADGGGTGADSYVTASCGRSGCRRGRSTA